MTKRSNIVRLFPSLLRFSFRMILQSTKRSRRGLITTRTRRHVNLTSTTTRSNDNNLRNRVTHIITMNVIMSLGVIRIRRHRTSKTFRTTSSLLMVTTIMRINREIIMRLNIMTKRHTRRYLNIVKFSSNVTIRPLRRFRRVKKSIRLRVFNQRLRSIQQRVFRLNTLIVTLRHALRHTIITTTIPITTNVTRLFHIKIKTRTLFSPLGNNYVRRARVHVRLLRVTSRHLGFLRHFRLHHFLHLSTHPSRY